MATEADGDEEGRAKALLLWSSSRVIPCGLGDWIGTTRFRIRPCPGLTKAEGVPIRVGHRPGLAEALGGSRS